MHIPLVICDLRINFKETSPSLSIICIPGLTSCTIAITKLMVNLSTSTQDALLRVCVAAFSAAQLYHFPPDKTDFINPFALVTRDVKGR